MDERIKHWQLYWNPNYGTLQIEDPNNTPGGRDETESSWTNSDGTLWLFGGTNAIPTTGTISFLNDMWKFDISTNNWTWMSGPMGNNTTFSYGTLNVEVPSNLPPARESYSHWQDANDNFYIFAGGKYDAVTFLSRNYNDVWKYNTHNNLWTWIGGSSTINDQGHRTQYCLHGNGVLPLSRVESRTAQSNTCSNYFWTFAGAVPTNQNDLWNFNLQTKEWTWVTGNGSFTGNFGTMGVPAITNEVPARLGPCLWADNSGALWMWGGMKTYTYKFSDMWKFVPDTSCTRISTILSLSAQLSDSIICPGDSARLYIAGGEIASISPSAFVTIIDSTHASLHPSSFTVYTIATRSDCGSVDTFRYTIRPSVPSMTSLNRAICHGSSIAFHGQQISTAGLYRDTLQNISGCDSIVTLTLTITPSIVSHLSRTICRGSSITFHGQTISSAGTYRDTLSTSSGCDSIIILTLTVSPPILANFSRTICTASSITFNGQIISNSGTYRDTLSTASGCDSIIILTVTIGPAIIANVSQTICAGSSITFNGQIISNSGTYRDTLSTASGCDSIIILTVTIGPAIIANVSQTICTGSSITFNGQIISNSGTYRDTLSTASGCDSIAVLTVTVGPVSITNISRTICAGSTITFNGQIISSAGTYRDTFSTSSGCDSIIVLTVTMRSAIITNISQTICTGSSITFNGQPISTAGIYRDTLSTASGCDSVIILTLSFGAAAITNISQTICDGSTITFHGQQISVAGIYRDTLLASSGCDSIIILTLTVRPSSFTIISQTICAGSIITFHGQSITIAGTYRDTIPSSSGCDSVITLDLSIYPLPTTTINQNICTGSSFVFNGHPLSATGIYRDTLLSPSGCDSIITLTLTVMPFLTTATHQNICDGSVVVFNGHTIAASGIYCDTLSSVAGCDSIVTLTVTAASTSVVDIDQMICAGDIISFNGISIANAGLYTDTLISATGCDSIVRLALSVTPRPIAGFTIEPIGDSLELGIISVVNTAQHYRSLHWQLNNQLVTLLNDSVLPISFAGDYCIKQEAIATTGCMDTLQRCINVTDDAFIMPNAFSPNGDGINDIFMGSGKGVKSYSLKVFNRWGELIFVSDQLSTGWDGTYKGSLQEPGIYVYAVNVALKNTKTHLYKGSVTLLR